MEEYIKISERITNNVIQEIKTLKNFDDWAATTKEVMQIIYDCQKVIKEKESVIQSNYESALTERITLKATREEQLNELGKLKQEYGLAEERCKVYHKEYEKQEQLCLESQKQKELSEHDKQVLYLAREKYKIYKEITNIIWDYTVPFDSLVSGYVINKSKSYIKPFMFKKHEITHENLVDNLWKEIQIGLQDVEMIDNLQENQENIINN